jgi:hypothetical protein
MLDLKSTRPAPLNKAGAGAFASQLKHNLTLALNDVGKSVHGRVRQPIKRHPGEESLYNSIRLDRATVNDQQVRIHTSSPIAVFRELDTKPHLILPRNKPMLAFNRRGRLIYAKRVKHPGTRGTHSWQHGSTAMRARLHWAYKYAAEGALTLKIYTKRYSNR